MDFLDKIETTPKIPKMILEQLFHALSSGQIKIGDELPSERELSTTLGVSRGSLRESLAILEFLGVIGGQGNKKVVIRDFKNVQKAMNVIEVSSQGDVILDFIEFRKVVEIFMLQLVFLRATPKDITAIRKSVEDLEKDPSNFEADREFHIALAQASHNAFLVSIEDLALTVTAKSRWRAAKPRGRDQEIIQEHKAILEAIERNDLASAKEAMLNHLRNAEKFFQNKKGEIDFSIFDDIV
ncbi:MAG: FadR/GntR family transcriptional regulator [Clostridia bacterium]